MTPYERNSKVNVEPHDGKLWKRRAGAGLLVAFAAFLVAINANALMRDFGLATVFAYLLAIGFVAWRVSRDPDDLRLVFGVLLISLVAFGWGLYAKRQFEPGTIEYARARDLWSTPATATASLMTLLTFRFVVPSMLRGEPKKKPRI